jgi:hypothetical protein
MNSALTDVERIHSELRDQTAVLQYSLRAGGMLTVHELSRIHQTFSTQKHQKHPTVLQATGIRV